MENKDTPAFPTITWEQMPSGRFVQVTEHSGLTKREKIAAMAMQGYIANSTTNQGYSSPSDYAEYAVKLADALLTELSKPNSHD